MNIEEMFQKSNDVIIHSVKTDTTDKMFLSEKEIAFNNIRTKLIINGVLKDRQRPKQKNNKRKKKKRK